MDIEDWLFETGYLAESLLSWVNLLLKQDI